MKINAIQSSFVILFTLLTGNAWAKTVKMTIETQNFSPLVITHYDVDELESVEKTIKNEPNNADAYLQRGLIRSHSQEDFTGAIEDFTQVINLNPNAEVYNYRGTAYFWLKQYQNALKDYTQAIDLDSNLALAYYNRAYVYLELGNIAEAITDFRQGATLSQQQGDTLSYQQALDLIQELEAEIEDPPTNLKL